MKKYKVFMTDSIFPDLNVEKRILGEIGSELTLASEVDPAFIGQVLKESDAVLTIYAPVSAEMINLLEKCKIILKMGIGVNNIDIKAATAKRIMVANVPDYCLGEVADHTIALLLALVRKVSYMREKVRQGYWDFNQSKPIPRLNNTVLGLIGFGRIAQGVASRARSFGTEVVAYDPYIPKEVFAEMEVKRIEALDQLFSISILCHCTVR